MAGFISAGMATALGQGIRPQQYHQQQRSNHYDPATRTMYNGGWANQQLMDQRAAGAANPQPGYWQPSFLQTPPTPYPTNQFNYAGQGGYGADHRPKVPRGGRGGNVFAGTFNAYEPSMFMGPGAYWPGHQAEFQGQQQVANQLIMAGRMAPDNRQPSQVAASMIAGRRSPNPWSRVAAGGSYVSGGGSSSGGGSLAEGYQAALDRANQANEARYRDILEGYNNRMGYLQGAGAQEAKDINRVYDNQAAAGAQHLVGRGLGNSTLVNTMNMGVDRERTSSLGRLEERLRGQYMDAQKDTMDFMERKNESGPDFAQLAALAQMEGASGGGNSAADLASLIRPHEVSLGLAGSGLGMAPVYGRMGARPSVQNKSFGTGYGEDPTYKYRILNARQQAQNRAAYSVPKNAPFVMSDGTVNPQFPPIDERRYGRFRQPYEPSFGLPLATDADLYG
jgi:hypothetical protein